MEEDTLSSIINHEITLEDSHPLRDPSSRRGILIMIDGTSYDWFQNGKKIISTLSY